MRKSCGGGKGEGKVIGFDKERLGGEFVRKVVDNLQAI